MKKRILIKNKDTFKKSLLKKIQKKERLSEMILNEGVGGPSEEFATIIEKKSLENVFPGLKELPRLNLEQEIADTVVQQAITQNPQQFSAYGKEINANPTTAGNYFSTADYLTSSAYEMKMQETDPMIRDTRENEQNRRIMPFSNEISFNPTQNTNYTQNQNKEQKKKGW